MGKKTSVLGWIIAGAIAIDLFGRHDEPSSQKSGAPASPAGNVTQDHAPPQPLFNVRPDEKQTPAPEILFATTVVNFRSAPGTSGSIITRIPRGAMVSARGSQGSWRQVEYGGLGGWVASRYLSATVAPLPAEGRRPAVSAPRQPRAAEQEHRSGEPIRDPYVGVCDCPYDRMRNGRRCGGNSAYSRPGGRSPVCYW